MGKKSKIPKICNIKFYIWNLYFVTSIKYFKIQSLLIDN